MNFGICTTSKNAKELFVLLLKGEYHGNNPEMSKLLHKAVRQKSESAFSVYQQHLANRPVNVGLKSLVFLIVRNK